MIEEQEGGEKQEESVLGLMRARKFLKRRFGTVWVSFGEPLSLAETMGERREALRDFDRSPEAAEGLRDVVETVGFRVVERINWATVANATSVAACALLGEGRRGRFRSELCARMQQVVELLQLQDVKLTNALDEPGDLDEAIDFLLKADLVKAADDPRGEVLFFEESHRRALELYRNAIVHYLAAPSFLARRLLAGATLPELRQDLASWLDLFYAEYFVPRGEVMAAHLEAFLDHFERSGRLVRDGDRYRPGEKGRDYFEFLAEQTRGMLEAYSAAFSAVQTIDGSIGRKALLKRAEEHFERGQLLGELARREASNPVTFGNAFTLLLEREILTTPPLEARERRREPFYARGERFEELEGLRGRLSAALRRR